MNHKVYIDENPLDVIDKDLIDKHFSEVGSYHPAVNNKVYDKLSCIAFYENGKQFAYYVYMMYDHSHYDKVVFQDVAYFIKKEFRLKYARQIFGIVEKVARELNCDLIINHCKTKSQINFFKKMDFIMKEYTIIKEL